ncbi:MAG: hypothetical protein OHK0029_39600 [Armatimonadaceae bacterium]
MFAPLTYLGFGYIGPQEIMIIGVVVLVLFGGSRIPQFARGFGEGIREFKKSLNGDEEASKSDSNATAANTTTKTAEEK